MGDGSFRALQMRWKDGNPNQDPPGQRHDCAMISPSTTGRKDLSWDPDRAGGNSCHHYYRVTATGKKVACRNNKGGSSPCKNNALLSGAIPWDEAATRKWMNETMSPTQSGGRKRRRRRSRRRRNRRKRTRRSTRGRRRRATRTRARRSRRRR